MVLLELSCHTIHLGLLLKCRLWFWGSWVTPRGLVMCTSSQGMPMLLVHQPRLERYGSNIWLFLFLPSLICKLFPNLIFHPDELHKDCLFLGLLLRCLLKGPFAWTALIHHIIWFYPCLPYWMFPDAPAKTHSCLNATHLWVSLHSLVFQFCPTLVLKICPEYNQNIISFFVKEDTYLISFLFVVLPKGF